MARRRKEMAEDVKQEVGGIDITFDLEKSEAVDLAQEAAEIKKNLVGEVAPPRVGKDVDVTVPPNEIIEGGSPVEVEIEWPPDDAPVIGRPLSEDAARKLRDELDAKRGGVGSFEFADDAELGPILCDPIRAGLAGRRVFMLIFNRTGQVWKNGQDKVTLWWGDAKGRQVSGTGKVKVMNLGRDVVPDDCIDLPYMLLPRLRAGVQPVTLVVKVLKGNKYLDVGTKEVVLD